MIHQTERARESGMLRQLLAISRANQYDAQAECAKGHSRCVPSCHS
jgi:hypothetical protein